MRNSGEPVDGGGSRRPPVLTVTGKATPGTVAVRIHVGEPPSRVGKPGGVQMKEEIEYEGSGPRWLPTLHVDGETYYIDLRLRQFRTAAPPHELIEFIEFESKRGRRMLDECVMAECQRCGHPAVVSREPNDAACLRCGRPLASARAPAVR